ncbi:MAG: RNA ligase family protein [Candidatus Kapaibacterium sp.]
MSIDRFKYPRTPHLPWSPGVSEDDIRVADVKMFVGKDVVVTEKMDGENTTMYTDYIHARSIDGRSHPSRNHVKQLHATIAHLIPMGWRLCGENLYAQHSIIYKNLRSYFYLFSVWDEKNNSLSWDEVVEWGQLFSLELPRVLYRGIWDQELVQSIEVDPVHMEGYVVRNAESFAYGDFIRNIAKWVRKDHVQTDEHWMYSEIIPNQLGSNSDIV